MNLRSTAFVLAGLLASCQSQQIQKKSHENYAQADMTLLQYAVNHATRADVYARVENGETKLLLPETELSQLKEILSRTAISPFTGGSRLVHWQKADIGIKLYGPAGELIFDLNPNTLGIQGKGRHLLSISAADMDKLRSLPTCSAAREYQDTENAYSRHCHHRQEDSGKLLDIIQRTTQAQVLLRNIAEDDEMTLPLEAEEYQQLLTILSSARPLPCMERAAWDTPEFHSQAGSRLPINSELQLLDEQDTVLYTIPLDCPYFAKETEADSFRQHEHNAETIALPDAQHAAFLALPFREKLQAAKAEMLDEYTRNPPPAFLTLHSPINYATGSEGRFPRHRGAGIESHRVGR